MHESNLIDQLISLANKPIEKACVMPTGVYFSEKFFEMEQEHIFHKEWLCAGREDDIPSSGDFITYQIGRQPIVITRLEDRSVHAMANVCRHRMMQIAKDRGNVKKFSCPYHGWTYGLDGRLIGAPQMQCTSGFDRKDYSLQSIGVEIWEGWIYVTLNPNAESVSDRLSKLYPIVQKYHMDRYKTVFVEDHEWTTNWKLLCENFMEGYHLPVAHGTTVGKDFPLNDTVFDEHGGSDGFTYQCFGKPEGALVGMAHPKNNTLRNQWRRTSVMPTIFPSHMYVLAPDHLWYLSIQPKGCSKVSIRYGAALAPELIANHSDLDTFISEFRSLLDRVQKEDRILVESIYKGAQAPITERGPLSWLEREIHEFSQYLARQLSK